MGMIVEMSQCVASNLLCIPETQISIIAAEPRFGIFVSDFLRMIPELKSSGFSRMPCQNPFSSLSKSLWWAVKSFDVCGCSLVRVWACFNNERAEWCVYVCVSREAGLLGCVSNEMGCAVCAHEFATRSGCRVVCVQPSEHCFSVICLQLFLPQTTTSHPIPVLHSHTFSFFCCHSLLNSLQLRVWSKPAWKQKKHIHCSHPSRLLVSQIIIFECSTLINAAPCLHWWELWLVSMIQYFYSTDLEITDMYGRRINLYISCSVLPIISDDLLCLPNTQSANWWVFVTPYPPFSWQMLCVYYSDSDMSDFVFAIIECWLKGIRL